MIQSDSLIHNVAGEATSVSLAVGSSTKSNDKSVCENSRNIVKPSIQGVSGFFTQQPEDSQVVRDVSTTGDSNPSNSNINSDPAVIESSALISSNLASPSKTAVSVSPSISCQVVVTPSEFNQHHLLPNHFPSTSSNGAYSRFPDMLSSQSNGLPIHSQSGSSSIHVNCAPAASAATTTATTTVLHARGSHHDDGSNLQDYYFSNTSSKLAVDMHDVLPLDEYPNSMIPKSATPCVEKEKFPQFENCTVCDSMSIITASELRHSQLLETLNRLQQSITSELSHTSMFPELLAGSPAPLRELFAAIRSENEELKSRMQYLSVKMSYLGISDKHVSSSTVIDAAKERQSALSTNLSSGNVAVFTPPESPMITLPPREVGAPPHNAPQSSGVNSSSASAPPQSNQSHTTPKSSTPLHQQLSGNVARLNVFLLNVCRIKKKEKTMETFFEDNGDLRNPKFKAKVIFPALRHATSAISGLTMTTVAEGVHLPTVIGTWQGNKMLAKEDACARALKLLEPLRKHLDSINAGPSSTCTSTTTVAADNCTVINYNGNNPNNSARHVHVNQGMNSGINGVNATPASSPALSSASHLNNPFSMSSPLQQPAFNNGVHITNTTFNNSNFSMFPHSVSARSAVTFQSNLMPPSSSASDLHHHYNENNSMTSMQMINRPQHPNPVSGLPQQPTFNTNASNGSNNSNNNNNLNVINDTPTPRTFARRQSAPPSALSAPHQASNSARTSFYAPPGLLPPTPSTAGYPVSQQPYFDCHQLVWSNNCLPAGGNMHVQQMSGSHKLMNSSYGNTLTYPYSDEFDRLLGDLSGRHGENVACAATAANAARVALLGDSPMSFANSNRANSMVNQPQQQHIAGGHNVFGMEGASNPAIQQHSSRNSFLGYSPYLCYPPQHHTGITNSMHAIHHASSNGMIKQTAATNSH